MKTAKKAGVLWNKLRSTAQKSFGHTLFVSYLAILAVSLSALLIFVRMSGRQLETETYRYSVLAQSQAAASVENEQAELRSLMNLVHTDKLYVSLIYATSPLGAYKLQNVGELREKLNSYTAFNSNIKDIYIWFSHPQVGVTTKGYVTSRDYFSSSLENELGISFDEILELSQGKTFTLCPVSKDGRTERLVAVIDRSIGSEGTTEILELNLQSFWAPMTISEDDGYMLWAVSDSTGLIASPARDQSLAAYCTGLTLKPGAINRVVFDGSAYAVMCSDELDGFSLYSAVDYSQWARNQQRYQLLTLIYCAVYVVLGLAFSALLSQRNARPIRQLSDMVSGSSPAPGQEGELAQLESSIRSLLKYSRDYARAMTREANRFRGEALAALLRSQGEPQVTAALAQCEKNGVLFPYSGFALAVFRIKAIDRFFPGASKTPEDPDALSLARFAVASVAGELMEKAGAAYTCQTDGQVWVIVCLAPSPEGPDRTLLAGLQEAGQFLSRQIGIDVCSYLSCPIDGPEALNDAYREACWAMEQMESYRLAKSPCTREDILERLSSRQPPRPEDTPTRQREFYSAVAAGDLEEGRRLYLELRCQNFSTDPASFGEVRTATAVLASYLLSNLSPETAEAHRDEIEGFFSDIRAEQHDRELTELMYRWMEFFHGLCQESAEKEQAGSGGIAVSAARYINDNYTDMNISVASVAEQFSVSPSHLSQLFRKKYGISALEYIHRRRLDTAKLLLRESDATVESIAVQVGYSNALALIRQFRKAEDRTPTEYRKSLQQPQDGR